MMRSTDSTISPGSDETNRADAPPPDGSAAALAVPLAGLAITVVVCILLWLRLLPLGVPGQWYWPLRLTALIPAPLTLLGLITLIIAAAYVLSILRSGPTRRQTATAVTLCTAAAGAMLMGLYAAEPLARLRTAQVTSSISAMPYFGAAVEAGSIDAVIGPYVADPWLAGSPDRIRTHPPGPVAYYTLAHRAILGSRWLTNAARDLLARDGFPPEEARRLAAGRTNIALSADDVAAGALASLLITLVGTLIPAAGFFVASAVMPSHRALLSTLLCAVIPSLIIVVPSIEGAGVVLALGAAGALLWAARLATPTADAPPRVIAGVIMAVLSGLLWAVSILWTVGLLALALPVGAALVCMVLRDTAARAGVLRTVAVAAATLCAAYMALYLLTGYSLPVHLVAIMDVQREIMAREGRDRAVWIWMNLYDVALFLGPALSVAAVAGASRLVGAIRSADAAGWLCLGGVAALLLLDLTGTTRGEVGRIWIFLMPILAITATRAAWADRPISTLFGLATITLAQLLHAIALHASIITVGV